METDKVQVQTAPPGPSPASAVVSVRNGTGGAMGGGDAAGTRPASLSRVQRRPRPQWRSVLAYGIGCLIVLAAVVASVISHSTLQRTDASIAELHVQLHRTSVQIGRARTRLAQAEQEAGAAASALASASDQLGKVQAQLASAQSNIQIDGVNIANLDTCLSGVNQALNEISLGDQSGASAILDRYAGNCQAAEPSG